MDEVEDDVDAALTWKALQDADVGVAEVHDSDVIGVPPVDGEETEHEATAVGEEEEEEDDDDDDDDVADFVQLADLPPYAEVVATAASALGGSDSHTAESEDTGVANVAAAPSSMPVASRFKRKNFNKHLQFMCLQRYADHVKTHGSLPGRSECQLLLHQSFAQFVREGGSADHPRLSYPEFLKLIRNRSRERQERLARTAAEAPQIQKTSAGSQALSRRPSSGKTALSRRGSRKRKWTDEVVKIDELIEVIDKARHRASSSGSASRTDTVASATRTPRRRPVKTSQVPITADPVQSTAINAHGGFISAVALVGAVESSDIVDSILRLQQETLSLQHVIKERLAVIQEQCRPQEPASASV